MNFRFSMTFAVFLSLLAVLSSLQTQFHCRFARLEMCLCSRLVLLEECITRDQSVTRMGEWNHGTAPQRNGGMWNLNGTTYVAEFPEWD